MRSRTPLVVVDKQIVECSHDSTLHKFVHYQSIIHRDQKFHNSGRTVNYTESRPVQPKIHPH